jgi:predicted DCC family thiol-disulfide oxidoreductase YuxK
MKWASIDASGIGHDVILFDGDCVLCSQGAHFVHRHDKAMRFKLTAIQSPFGRELAQRFGIDADTPQTYAVVMDGRAYFRSDATIALLKALPGWRWATALQIFPRPLRDWVYDRVARNRYQWFGRRDQCWAGDPQFRARILENA